MEFILQGKGCAEIDGVVVPVFETETLDTLCDDVKDTIACLNKDGKFKGGRGEIYTFTKAGNGYLKTVILLGFGKKDEVKTDDIRLAYAKALRKAKELKLIGLGIKYFKIDGICRNRILKCMVEGISLADYAYDKYKSVKSVHTVKNVVIMGIEDSDMEALQFALKEGLSLVEGSVLARDLTNEPANDLYPETLAERAKELGEQYGFEVEVKDENEIRELKMDAFMSVAKGSDKAPRLIVMRYFGNEADKSEIIGLVGKGLTYDAGGYSLKPNSGMVDMKTDMAGAASVIGTMCAAANMKLKVNVVAVVAACENLVSGHAYKPGDIISSMAGKTIEVGNADAEGRLTLADAVYYIGAKENVTRVIDVATLTGAAVRALGMTTTAVITNDDDFYSALLDGASISDEKFWQFPSFDEYRDMIKSDIADLVNTSGAYAGTITAGLFIEEFLAKKMPWLHLDIAGTAESKKDAGYLTKGGTGAPVRTLYYLVRGYQSKAKSCEIGRR